MPPTASNLNTLLILVNAFVVISFLWRGLTVLVSVRDEMRDLKKAVGALHPPSGLLGDVADNSTEISRHRDILTVIATKLGLEPPGERK